MQPYQLIRSKRKTLSLQINAQGNLVVRAPVRLKLKDIEQFITEKQSWITNKQADTKQKIIPKPSYQNGDVFLFLGQAYPLKCITTGDPLKFDNQTFYLNTNFDGKAAFHWFYKKEFEKIALPRLAHYAQKHDLHFNQIRFKAQKTRWGSCSAKGNINLNYLLIMAPMSVINTIIAHELAHLIHQNHSKNFYALLAKMLPDYKHADIWLKQHRHKLHNFR